MRLRSRLFLWIASLLLLAGITSCLLEIFVTAKELKRTKEQLYQKIEGLNQKKREQIERFVTSSIQENQARIDLLLERLSSYPLEASSFAPTAHNLEKGTWLAASEILLNNQWLDFIQNTNQGQIASLIIPRTTVLDSSQRIPITNNLAWITLDTKNSSQPYLGIRVHFHSINPQIESDLNKSPSTLLTPHAYVLFDSQQLQFPTPAHLTTPIFKGDIPPMITNVPWMEGIQVDLSSFFTSFTNAREYIHTHNPPVIAQSQQTHHTPSSLLEKTLQDLVATYDQRYLIWCLSFMHAGQIFGNHLFTPPAPQGIALYSGDDLQGKGINTHKLFFYKKAFDDELYYQQHMPPDLTSHLGSHIAVFQSFDLPHLYLGNTAQYHIQNEKTHIGYLTLATNIDHILQAIVLAMDQTVLVVHQGKIITGLTETGQIIDQYPIMPEILDQPSGILEWNDISYYFLQITPLPDLDLHFFLFNPTVKEFALLTDLTQGAASVIHTILINVHTIGFASLLLAIVILHYLARRITQPLTRLAIATSHIKEGHLEDASIPIPAENDTDEVAMLCRSFHQMVLGLKEKEKVKAVLNKVVSQEIAQEILKGNIHLGGEETKATVLFADIRGFTKMTQNMPPKDVIELLNGCMTKISNLVDQHRGVIDKYVGDAAMALFGAPLPSSDSAYEAILCAIEMIDLLKTWNLQRNQQGMPSVEIGIGIHTGTVLAGNMGAENRLNYTVLGSNVNLAARLCAAAQPMEILISEQTLEEPHVANHLLYEKTSPMHFKGFDLPIIVYRIQGKHL